MVIDATHSAGPVAETGSRQGRIVQVSDTGVGVIEGLSDHGAYAFTFDKIRGYRGESIREMALGIGTRVTFRTTGHCVLDVILQR
ncbi:MAG: hypothetical protein GVY28_04600 [Alphaproteobacteria bacterium]|jgi:hypothetical protein|nr:hypothetical protein [Alphaproteobacteria bacterium]